jgi:methionine synthase II (cobalamin-independent)
MELNSSYLATGIGSFPHKEEGGLLSLIRKSFPNIPFWPQLPNRSFLEGMVAQYSEGFPSLKVDEKEQRLWVDTSPGFEIEVERFYQSIEKGDIEPFHISEQVAIGLRLLKDFSQKSGTAGIKYIKGQVTGPITFGLSLTDQEKKPIFYDPTLREILLDHLSMKTRWLERRFDDLFPGIPKIIFFDEPGLSAFGSAFSGLNRDDVVFSLNKCFSAVQGFKGVHCCGNTDWSVLLSTNLDILSFDAYGYLENLSLYPKELRNFLERGGILAWGIVPTSEEVLKEDAQSLVKRFRKGVEVLSKEGIDPVLLKRAILTPSCGTASLPIPLAERVCELTAEVSTRLREEKIF